MIIEEFIELVIYDGDYLMEIGELVIMIGDIEDRVDFVLFVLLNVK